MLDDVADLFDELVDRGLLIPVEAGIFAFGRVFVELRDGVERAVRQRVAQAVDQDVEVPPLLPLGIPRTAGFAAAFPHLLLLAAGSDDAAAALTEVGSASDGDAWAGAFATPVLALPPAVCHGVYPMLPNPLPARPHRVAAVATCFRNETSAELGRFRSFRMLEVVCAGPPDAVEDFTATSLEAASVLFEDLGLDTRPEAATDPFFVGDRLARLASPAVRKTELRSDLVPGDRTTVTALASLNRHGDHFARSFGLRGAGPVASACIGFGLERIALALLGRHGLATSTWPLSVRAALTG